MHIAPFQTHVTKCFTKGKERKYKGRKEHKGKETLQLRQSPIKTNKQKKVFEASQFK